jgi:hypothetical protein
MRKTFAVGPATSGTGCPTRVGRANRRAFEITPQRDNSSGQPHRRQTIDYLDQGTIDYRDHSHRFTWSLRYVVIAPAGFCTLCTIPFAL